MTRSTTARAAVLLLVAFGLCSSVASAQSRPASPQKSGEIHGTVALCGTGSVEGALVYIPGRNFQATLAANGIFVLYYVPVGTYTLVVQMPNRPRQSVLGVAVADNTITTVDTITLCRDDDADGYTEDVDCNDNNPGVHPGATEVCDGRDNNCDGVVDEGCTTCTDADNDGYFAQAGCGTAVDCNDGGLTVHPGAAEACDLIDNDCDGTADEVFDLQTDAANCGTCGNVCSMPNATASCVQGQCGLASCAVGYADCDGLAGDGCEALLASDASNCGTCGNACGAGTYCSAGTCIATSTCQSDAECNDGNLCNGSETCSGGVCQPGTAPSCDDGIACTVDWCEAATATCSHTALAASCDDSNPCTNESCDPTAGGCVTTPVPDNTPCGTNLVCTAGVCRTP